jgi:hypothetical protein
MSYTSKADIANIMFLFVHHLVLNLISEFDRIWGRLVT